MTHGNDRVVFDNETAEKAFDGSVYTRWSFQKTANFPWIAWTFYNNHRAVANMYDITISAEPARDPKHWRIYGSNGEDVWVQLDERINMAWSGRYQTRRFTMNNVVAYNAYKFEFIERSEDDPEMNMYQISEFSQHSSGSETQYVIYDPFIFGDTTNYAVQESSVTDLQALKGYLVARDAYPKLALKNTRVLALSGMTLEGIQLFRTSLSQKVKSTNPIDLYFYSDHVLDHKIDATMAIPLISLSEFACPSRIVFGDGSMKCEGMASVIQWMVDNRDKGYFVNLAYFQISGHKAASFDGSEEEGISLQNQIVTNLHLLCTDKSNFPNLKELNFNNNAYNEFNNGFDAALRGACDPEATGVTIRAYQVSVWYPPMCSATNADNYSYYNRDDETEVAQCRYTWNWEVSEE